MEYMIADCSIHRCGQLKEKMDHYKKPKCTGIFEKETELLERAWVERPDLVMVYVGDRSFNAFSVLRRIKEVTPEVRVAFYSDRSEYAVEAYEHGADYFLPLPADDIQFGKLVFRFLKTPVIS